MTDGPVDHTHVGDDEVAVGHAVARPDVRIPHGDAFGGEDVDLPTGSEGQSLLRFEDDQTGAVGGAADTGALGEGDRGSGCSGSRLSFMLNVSVTDAACCPIGMYPSMSAMYITDDAFTAVEETPNLRCSAVDAEVDVSPNTRPAGCRSQGPTRRSSSTRA